MGSTNCVNATPAHGDATVKRVTANPSSLQGPPKPERCFPCALTYSPFTYIEPIPPANPSFTSQPGGTQTKLHIKNPKYFNTIFSNNISSWISLSFGITSTKRGPARAEGGLLLLLQMSKNDVLAHGNKSELCHQLPAAPVSWLCLLAPVSVTNKET